MNGALMLKATVDQIITTWSWLLSAEQGGDLPELVFLASTQREFFLTTSDKTIEGTKRRVTAALTFEEQVLGVVPPAAFRRRAEDGLRILREILPAALIKYYPARASDPWEDTIVLESLGLSESLGMKFGWGTRWVRAAMVECEGYKYYARVVAALLRRRSYFNDRPAQENRPPVATALVPPVLYCVSPFHGVHADKALPEQLHDVKYQLELHPPVETSKAMWRETATAFQRYSRRNGRVNAAAVDELIAVLFGESS
ncbi:hypothetical protein GNI_100400 [Gregarina niphandrodes]|uniref:Uncharacterized protein n=1 Tax=Gregarina niphandrodes TaxID=110365 RepID=A0A023B4X2_GRENI|nr:hypothetical protein GNI_100400 [Gregarina niphandrodes]EZG56864.1 hypothetical protein GNI_100400 [Gregarina niphandrodes]|eukprot:XP_011131130.1 hypothetical protein GNI_100400 [Gregarina niphandrodes]